VVDLARFSALFHIRSSPAPLYSLGQGNMQVPFLRNPINLCCLLHPSWSFADLIKLREHHGLLSV